ncbi:hypothetical protein [Bacteroides sp. 519]|uniref:hypothetical protein n=1 Tax=Bacteroides sp. 519 TaxID=2302937 RepID=UPI0013D0FD80|nr:hypothetical protein [Bacteroides sp. 519]
MKKRLSYLVAYIPLLLLFAGCEFDSDKTYFIDVDKPHENAEMYINLNGIEPGSTIFVVNGNCFSFNIDTKGKKILKIIITHNDNNWEVYTTENGRGEFCIPNYSMDGKETPLTMEIAVSSGSGSLADLMGYEGYLGKVEYKVRYITDFQEFININHRKNEEGFLELYWNDLKKEGMNVKEYIIKNSSDVVLGTTEGTSFVDKSFFIGGRDYHIEVKLNNSSSYYTYTSVYAYTQSEVQTKRNNKFITVSWQQPEYRGRYLVKWSDDQGEHSSELLPYETLSYDIPFNLFGSNISGTVNYVPYENEEMYFTYTNFYYNDYQTEIGSFINHAYNKKDNIFYLYNGDIRGINLHDMSVAATRNHDNEGFYAMSTSPVNSKTAVAGYNRIFIFPDKSLSGPVVIQNEASKNGLHLTSKDHLALYTREDYYDDEKGYTYRNMIRIYNVLTGEELYTFYTNNSSDIEHITSTYNGEYLVLASKNGIEIYQLTTTKAILVYKDNKYYKGAQSLPNQPENILLKEDDYVIVCRASDCTRLTQSKAYPNMTLGNVDPVTGVTFLYTKNYTQSNNIVFLDTNTLNEVYNHSYNTFDDYYLYNGILIKSNGNYYNINDEIK